MNKINKIFNILKENKKYALIGAIILLAVLYFIFAGGNGKTEIYTVGRTDVEQSVVLSGKVETSDKADLGFADSGRLGKIFVKNNQNVVEGQILAQLEIGDLLADLKIKQANYKTSDIDLESDVENAYRTLISDDLKLVPDSDDYKVDPPVVGGLYDGLEGRYKIIISRENITSNDFYISDFYISTFNLEKTKNLINKNGSTPLGTKGLYVSFNEGELDSFDGTIWYLDIPNKSSSSYLANYNAYNEAKKRLDSSDNGGVSSAIAQAEIQKINAEIRKNTIYAPFSGKVTNIEKEVGESASVGERIVSVLGKEKLEIVLQVSELDVSRLIPDSLIKIALDAFPGEEFYGTLKTVNSRETEIDGVPVYEAFVELQSEEKVKTGMSANGTVIINTKNDVLAVPSYLIKKVDNVNIVEVIDEKGEKSERVVTLGILGTDNMVEIISGLSEGEKIISISK